MKHTSKSNFAVKVKRSKPAEGKDNSKSKPRKRVKTNTESQTQSVPDVKPGTIVGSQTEDPLTLKPSSPGEILLEDALENVTMSFFQDILQVLQAEFCA